jgi:hypothetical protein
VTGDAIANCKHCRLRMMDDERVRPNSSVELESRNYPGSI